MFDIFFFESIESPPVVDSLFYLCRRIEKKSYERRSRNIFVFCRPVFFFSCYLKHFETTFSSSLLDFVYAGFHVCISCVHIIVRIEVHRLLLEHRRRYKLPKASEIRVFLFDRISEELHSVEVMIFYKNIYFFRKSKYLSKKSKIKL